MLHYTRLERLDKGKRSSLLEPFVIYEENWVGAEYGPWIISFKQPLFGTIKISIGLTLIIMSKVEALCTTLWDSTLTYPANIGLG